MFCFSVAKGGESRFVPCLPPTRIYGYKDTDIYFPDGFIAEGTTTQDTQEDLEEGEHNLETIIGQGKRVCSTKDLEKIHDLLASFLGMACQKSKSKQSLHEAVVSRGELSPDTKRCPICSCVLKTNDDLKVHISLKHEGEGLECEQDMCHRFFITPTALRHHQNTHRKESCEVCVCCTPAQSFVSKNSLRVHQKDMADREENPNGYSCLKCRQNFVAKRYLKDHLKKCGKIPHIPCPSCDKMYRSVGLLNRHMRNKHACPL